MSLVYEPKAGWEIFSDREKKEVHELAEDYKSFLDRSKTERECVETMVKRAGEKGIVTFEELFKHLSGKKSSLTGRKYMIVNREKALAIVAFGKRSISEGARVLVSHIDSPRIDLKAHPLYEDGKLAFLKTHYYGGIKKYQWASIPLSLHGVVITKNGKKVRICIGEDESDPVFLAPDLAIHLAGRHQMERKSSETIKGEELNIVAGSLPAPKKKLPKDCKNPIKYAILEILEKKYGIVEKDLLSAEIEAVPAQKARDAGLDSSLIAGYGHDDRVCAFTSFRAILDVAVPEYTSVALFFDKEEIGSAGNTSATSMFMSDVFSTLLAFSGEAESYMKLRAVMSRSQALSADVTEGFNPTFSAVFDQKNVPYIGYGLAVMKYCGSRGKSGSNDASAEFAAHVFRIFDEDGVNWQTGELGKVDEGGGGTVAKFLGELNMDVIDCGTPVLGLHAPVELVSKADVYSTYRGYRAFLSRK